MQNSIKILSLVLFVVLSLAACNGEAVHDDEQLPELGAHIPADRPSAASQEDAGVDGSCGADCACEATAPRTSPTTVSALPEAGEKPFVDLLDRAQTSIRVMVYLMGYGGILDRLEAKAKAGVSVRVILDEGKASVNQKYRDQLVAAGAQVLWSDPKFPYMHAKVIIVDEKEAVLSTGNFSKKYSIDLERNFVAHISDPEDLADLVALFEADWSRGAPDVSCTRLLVSPLNARQRLLELIDSATHSLTIESMQFADSDVRSHVAARRAAGVDVRAILADASWISANKWGAAFLEDRDIEVRWIPHCHTKAIVVDGARAFLGSENLSYTSLSKNREIGVVLTEPAPVKIIADTFEKDWAGATPF
jgi:phosphatidylserine/phosphatidylglycerophosphate/cardiolipin synthase-like enzyme